MKDELRLELPKDLYRAEGREADEYRNLDKAGGEARLKRIDIVASVYYDELQHGKQGLNERVMKRLELDVGAKSSKTAVADSVRVFRTFRLGGDDGLGYPREELDRIPFSRLRTIAQHHDWAIRNRDKVPHALTLKEEGTEGKETLRDFIHSSDPERYAKKKKADFVSRELRFTAESAALFDDFIRGIYEATRELTPYSKNAPTRLGEIVVKILGDWYNDARPHLDDNGRPILDDTGRLMTYDYLHLLPAPEVDEGGEDYDVEEGGEEPSSPEAA